jgi:hypothetical protein
LNEGLVSILLATIAAAGSVLTAYVAVIARQTRAEVNGRMSELIDRISVLEQQLVIAERDQHGPVYFEDFS